MAASPRCLVDAIEPSLQRAQRGFRTFERAK
jgi:hypothetical protein